MPCQLFGGIAAPVARNDRSCFLLRGKWRKAPIGDKRYVILSVSEISHDQSEKYMPVSSSVGFFTIVQNDV